MAGVTLDEMQSLDGDNISVAPSTLELDEGRQRRDAMPRSTIAAFSLAGATQARHRLACRMRVGDSSAVSFEVLERLPLKVDPTTKPVSCSERRRQGALSSLPEAFPNSFEETLTFCEPEEVPVKCLGWDPLVVEWTPSRRSMRALQLLGHPQEKAPPRWEVLWKHRYKAALEEQRIQDELEEEEQRKQREAEAEARLEAHKEQHRRALRGSVLEASSRIAELFASTSLSTDPTDSSDDSEDESSEEGSHGETTSGDDSGARGSVARGQSMLGVARRQSVLGRQALIPIDANSPRSSLLTPQGAASSSASTHRSSLLQERLSILAAPILGNEFALGHDTSNRLSRSVGSLAPSREQAWSPEVSASSRASPARGSLRPPWRIPKQSSISKDDGYSGDDTTSAMAPHRSHIASRSLGRLPAGPVGLWDGRSRFHMVRDLFDDYAADPLRSGPDERPDSSAYSRSQVFGDRGARPGSSSDPFLERYVERQREIEGLLSKQLVTQPREVNNAGRQPPRARKKALYTGALASGHKRGGVLGGTALAHKPVRSKV